MKKTIVLEDISILEALNLYVWGKYSPAKISETDESKNKDRLLSS